MSNNSHSPLILGTCHIFLAFEVANAIDLRLLPELVSASRRAHLPTKPRGPKYEGFQCPPVTIALEVPPWAVGSFITEPIIEATVFDFGAISLCYRIPLHHSMPELAALSEELYEAPPLIAHAKERLESLLSSIAPALTKAEVSPLIEDYLLFEITGDFQKTPISDFVMANLGNLGSILTGETIKVASNYHTSLLSRSVSTGENDLLLIDWHAAILLNYEASDVRAVVEFVNVELLGLRFLDQRLDIALDESYRFLLSQRRLRRLFLPGVNHYLRKVARLQVESAILFEGVNNSLKFFSDQFLGRVYNRLTHQFCLTAWDSSIVRKLDTLQSVYSKMNDQLSQTRMEILEIAIIILILISLILPH